MKIAFIGLGAMGLPMARRLAGEGGAELSLFDISSAHLAAAAGLGRQATSVADAARDADAVFTVLPADPHVEAVAAELAEVARPGLVYVDFSTIAPATIDRVASTLAAVGVATVSVTVTRGTAAARTGELALFVGGDLIPELESALRAIATEIRPTGGLGAAKAVKIGNNVVVACIDVAICEAIVLGRKLGLAANELTDELEAAGGASWALRNHVVKHVLADDLGPGGFSTKHMAKDVRLFIALAGEHGFAAPLAGIALSCYRGTIAAGYGEDYHPVVIRWLEQNAASGPRPDGEGDRAQLVVLARAVNACQMLTTLEALRVMRAAGIAPSEAVAHLESGSGANSSLALARDHLERGVPLPVALAADIASALELADAVNVPALMLEAGRHSALLYD